MAHVFAAALGHHHADVLTAAPAIVGFVLLTDRHAVLRARVLAGVACILALGLGQYGFILLRSRQAAPYLASHATNLAEMVIYLVKGKDIRHTACQRRDRSTPE